MKNKLIGFLATGIIAASLITACGGNNPSPSTSGSTSTSVAPSVKKNIALSATSAEIIYGESYILTAIYTPVAGQEVIWSSSDESVATVVQGTVQSIGVGEANITATFNGESATCKIKVTYGDYNPVLNITNISNNELGLAVGNIFAPATSVLFNGNLFKCSSKLTSVNPAVAEIDENNNIVAKSIGTTRVRVVGIWKGFEGALMQQDILVTVSSDIVFYTESTIGGRKTVSNNIDLGLVASFEGKTYDTTATVKAVIKENGVEQVATLDYEKNGVIEMDDNGLVTAKSVGSCVITATYSSSGVDYHCTLTVNVTCPVQTYDKGTIRFCSTENFPVESTCGSGARIVKAKQGKTELRVKNLGKRLEGIIANGSDTEPIEIQTTKGGYLFNKMFCYTKALTNANAVSELTLQDGKVLDGYYILAEDLDIDMSSQRDSAYAAGATATNTYFGGTLDGELHTFKAKVGTSGIFGGFGNNAIIKNTHFDFVFGDTVDPYKGIVGVGLARNTAVWSQTTFSATLDNLYFTAHNYKEKCYTLYDFKIVKTVMNNVYVNLTGSGSSSMAKFTDRAQEIAALWHVDTIIMSGSYNAFKGDLNNVHVVTDTASFIPVGCGYWKSGSDDDYYVSYAKTDTSGGATAAIGPNNRHHVQPNESYCIALYAGEPNTNKLHFGNLKRNLNGGEFCAYSYDGMSDKKEWGICRFNTTAALKTFIGPNTTKIGSWPIDA